MSGSDESPPDWKLRLRYGRLETPYSHFTLLGAGDLRASLEWSDCRPGPVVLGMKIWASSRDEAFAVFSSVSDQIGFEVTDKIDLYETEPSQPPRGNPYGYDLNFTPFER